MSGARGSGGQADPFFTLIRGANVFAPKPLGVTSVLTADSRILKIGAIEPADVEAMGVPFEVVEADGRLLVPGLLDPHVHSAGAGGEQGFGSRTPPIQMEELVRSGVTSLVGCLGADTTARSLTDLLGKTRQLHEAGVSAYMLTGGYPVPSPAITGSVQDDLVIIPEVLGAGEIAISDTRSVEPPPWEIAKVVAGAMVGGSLGGKAGITQFHTGPGSKRLQCLRSLVEQTEVPPESLYVLHINRSEELLLEAVDMAKQGAWVDTDTLDEDTVDVLRFYLSHGGPPEKLSFSSDHGAVGGSVRKLWRMFQACARDGDWALDQVLPHFTTNAADAMRLKQKGRIEEGADADLLVLEPESFELVHLFARGRQLVRNGRLAK
jgi:beta-aspartyl-dipeptidase (metallo-type)